MKVSDCVYYYLAHKYVKVGSDPCHQWCMLTGCCGGGSFYTPGKGDVRLPVLRLNPPDPHLACPTEPIPGWSRCKVNPNLKPKHAKKSLGIDCK